MTKVTITSPGEPRTKVKEIEVGDYFMHRSERIGSVYLMMEGDIFVSLGTGHVFPCEEFPEVGFRKLDSITITPSN